MQSQVATLKNAVTRVTSESRAKNDFIAILAHELRNPLTPVVSGIELLKLKDRDKDEQAVLDAMQESMRTVRSLLNDLLDVSKISEGKIALKKVVMDLEPSLDNAVLSTDHHRKERHQSLIFKTPRARLNIYGDPVRIEQIFSNLLTNASKYSNEGDTITLRARENDGFAVIEVEDQGLGLEPHAIETIFEPFQQVENGERASEGLGIGLSLVKDFVKMHGGRVWAESEGRNKGSRFIVRLPLMRSDADEAKMKN
jgi:two-component system CheB/CheR fusion protein